MLAVAAIVAKCRNDEICASPLSIASNSSARNVKRSMLKISALSKLYHAQSLNLEQALAARVAWRYGMSIDVTSSHHQHVAVVEMRLEAPKSSPAPMLIVAGRNSLIEISAVNTNIKLWLIILSHSLAHIVTHRHRPLIISLFNNANALTLSLSDIRNWCG